MDTQADEVAGGDVAVGRGRAAEDGVGDGEELRAVLHVAAGGGLVGGQAEDVRSDRHVRGRADVQAVAAVAGGDVAPAGSPDDDGRGVVDLQALQPVSGGGRAVDREARDVGDERHAVRVADGDALLLVVADEVAVDGDVRVAEGGGVGGRDEDAVGVVAGGGHPVRQEADEVVRDCEPRDVVAVDAGVLVAGDDVAAAVEADDVVRAADVDAVVSVAGRGKAVGGDADGVAVEGVVAAEDGEAAEVEAVDGEAADVRAAAVDDEAGRVGRQRAVDLPAEAGGRDVRGGVEDGAVVEDGQFAERLHGPNAGGGVVAGVRRRGGEDARLLSGEGVAVEDELPERTGAGVGGVRDRLVAEPGVDRDVGVTDGEGDDAVAALQRGEVARHSVGGGDVDSGGGQGGPDVGLGVAGVEAGLRRDGAAVEGEVVGAGPHLRPEGRGSAGGGGADRPAVRGVGEAVAVVEVQSHADAGRVVLAGRFRAVHVVVVEGGHADDVDVLRRHGVRQFGGLAGRKPRGGRGDELTLGQ